MRTHKIAARRTIVCGCDVKRESARWTVLGATSVPSREREREQASRRRQAPSSISGLLQFSGVIQFIRIADLVSSYANAPWKMWNLDKNLRTAKETSRSIALRSFVNYRYLIVTSPSSQFPRKPLRHLYGYIVTSGFDPPPPSSTRTS